MLLKRLASAFLLIPIALFSIIAAHHLVYMSFIALISILLNYELLTFRKTIQHTSKVFTYIFILIIYFLKYCNLFQPTWLSFVSYFSMSDYIIFIIIFQIFTVSIHYIFNKSFKHSLNNIAFTTLILMYTGVITSYAIDIKYIHLIVERYQALDQTIDIHHGVKYIGMYYMLFFILICWGYDTGAYFAGKYLGKVKLGLSASPKKSWAGIVGGLLFSTIAYGIVYKSIHYYHESAVSYTLFGNKPIWYGLMFTLLLAIVCQLGDLVVSVFKRSVNRKHSSNIIAGHGGVLDRLDSTIPTLFVGYLLLRLGII